MTGFEKLENSLIDVIKEEQANLGFKENLHIAKDQPEKPQIIKKVLS